MKYRSLRSLFVWMATLAVLMGTLAPLISQALQTGTSAEWASVCTASGSQWAKLDGQGQAPKPNAAHLFEHCPYCTLHALAIETPQVKIAAPLRTVRYELHWLYAAATPTLDIWSSSLSRGPPRNV